jgi:hypothetical protein
LFLLLLLSWQSVAADTSCASDYPPDLPCVAGGTHQRTVDLFGEMKSMIFTYPMSKEALSEVLKNAIEESEWQVKHWRRAEEPDGDRIRGSITKGDRSVGISIYKTNNFTVLQVTLVR